MRLALLLAPHRGGRHLPGGIYFLRLEAAGESSTKKMVLVAPRRTP